MPSPKSLSRCFEIRLGNTESSAPVHAASSRHTLFAYLSAGKEISAGNHDNEIEAC